MPTSENVDLIITGAGPAGISTALHLIQEDPSWTDRLILLEKETHPRAKLCGGGVTRLGLQTLLDLGFTLPLPLPQARVDNVLITYKSRVIHVRGEPMFIVFDRPEFDHFLVQKAREQGVKIQENEAVKSFSLEQNQVIVTSDKGDYCAKAIAGADGTRGLVAKTIRGIQTPKPISRTLEFCAPAETDSPRFKDQSALFNFDFLSEHLQGYYWEFPMRINGRPAHNRGVYDSRLAHDRHRADLTAILEEGSASRKPVEYADSIKGAPIRWFNPGTKISTHRAVLVGDAAGVEVLFGEGIGPALVYGKIAAREIHQAFQAQDFQFKAYKRRLMLSKFGRYLFTRWLLANLIYHYGHRVTFTHIFWTAGQLLAAIWRGKPLY